MKRTAIIFLTFMLLQYTNAQNTKSTSVTKSTTVKQPAKERLVEIVTSYGNMVVKLYDSTPHHRDNFIKLVQSGFYDSLLFHRVIKNFMIQGGDPGSRHADSGAVLGNGEAPGDMIPAEFKPNLFHKKGALAAARTDNPEKASSNCQFYIVQGKTYADIDLNMMECNARNSNPAFTYSATQRRAYKTLGGTPFLDQNYTVFGEVIKGIEVIDKIAAVSTDSNDRPLQNVIMKIKLLN